MPPIADFLLTLRAAQAGVMAEATFTASGRAPAATPAVPVAFDLDALRALSDDPGVYGRALTAALFASTQLRDSYMRAAGVAAGAQTALRLRLRIDPTAADLAGLRWETLHDPNTVRPLAMSEQLLFARTADSPDLSAAPLPPRPQLQSLLAVAGPADVASYGLSPIDVQAELERMRDALADVPTSQLPGTGAARRHTTLNAIIDGLRGGAHMLVLVAHGRMADGHPVVYFCCGSASAPLLAAGVKRTYGRRNATNRPSYGILETTERMSEIAWPPTKKRIVTG